MLNSLDNRGFEVSSGGCTGGLDSDDSSNLVGSLDGDVVDEL